MKYKYRLNRLIEQRLKGSNRRTGESFSMIIGSDRFTKDGLSLTINSVHNGTYWAFTFIFDDMSNLIKIIEYEFVSKEDMDYKHIIPSETKVTSVFNIKNVSRKETFRKISSYTSKAFAKKLIAYVERRILSN